MARHYYQRDASFIHLVVVTFFLFFIYMLFCFYISGYNRTQSSSARGVSLIYIPEDTSCGNAHFDIIFPNYLLVNSKICFILYNQGFCISETSIRNLTIYSL